MRIIPEIRAGQSSSVPQGNNVCISGYIGWSIEVPDISKKAPERL